jgi:hypothetical protein
MVKETFKSLEDVYVISAAQGGRTRDVALEAKEWNIMALVDGYRSIREVCKASTLDDNEAIKKLAQLKLAGIITKTEKKEIKLPADAKTSDGIETMVNRLANLFEDYLTEKSRNRMTSDRLTKTTMEQK